MKKFPKIRYPGDEATDGIRDGNVVVTEKFDGANFRFTWNEEGGLIVGTRNVVYEPNDDNIPNAFGHAIEYIEDTVTGASWDNSLLKKFVYFGEAMHLHSLDYEGIEWEQPHKGSAHVPFDSEIPNVLLFDVWDQRNDEWVHWDSFVDLVMELDMEHSPILECGNPDNLSFDVPNESYLGGPPEGIVARRVDGTVRAKKVTDDFKEKNAVSFNDPSKARSDAGAFVSTYVTDARIEKIAHKLVDSGEYEQLEMPMMEDLPRDVLTDIMSEHGWELLTSGSLEVEWDNDFKSEVRSKTSKKCARVLKSELQSF